MVHEGPSYGYFVNTSKTWLVIKEQYHEKATAVFASTGVKITSNGRPYLGAAIGTEEYVKRYVESKVRSWTSEVQLLSDIAKSQLHAAFCLRVLDT